ncbi:hypothetical protein BDY24DRAFT_375844 [Mrakia frigida]|uniref:zinc finger MYND domain-containing protein n=1 Tax=Mrakia frigida TaxID=29902 RepID=UPI003FCBF9C4
MALPTPAAYGRLLGLSTGIDGPASSLITHPTTALFEGTLAASRYITRDILGEESRAFVEEFSSQFFPSFVQTFNGLGSNRPARSLCCDIFHGLCVESNLYLELAEALQDVSEISEILLVAHDNKPSQICSFITTFCIFVVTLAVHLPTDSALPSLPSSTNARIRHLLALLEEDSRFEPYAIPLNFYVLERVVGDLSLKSVRQLTQRGTKQVWWSCEIERKPTDLVCTKPAEAREMMACSRCLAVRYCSKEHQRLDWKRHKLVCFKATW